MSDNADYEFDFYFAEPTVDWALDPLDINNGGMLAVRRVALVRIACVSE